MIYSILILTFMLSYCSESAENSSSENPTNPPSFADTSSTSQDPALTFLALGDSYTIGESVPENDRWCIQLSAALRNEGIFIGSTDIIARTGWTTAELIDAIALSGNKRRYSMVSLLIGVNNQYRGQDLETYRKEFAELLKIATNYAGGNPSQVIVLSIPDWGITPFAQTKNVDKKKVAGEIDAFNLIGKEECAKTGIAFIDITGISRRAGHEKAYIASDGLHFSGKMYALWAEEALLFARKALKK